ncbi:E3 ubiquitin-protein ligase TRIM33-like isoform X2 [Littorina saxatilis]|uniref:E3 ubiquitin-protein ligase TRIM33-like isoform X2 n=1 Tax=Littorina saxatilis TaxID=31220 RepID=UPI0038B54E85
MVRTGVFFLPRRNFLLYLLSGLCGLINFKKYLPEFKCVWIHYRPPCGHWVCAVKRHTFTEVIMAAASATSSSELPECPVCHDGYQEPKILPCTHLVCKQCVVSWLQKAGVQGGCPLCRARILPSTSQLGHCDLNTLVNDLPTDLATMALVDSHKTLSGQHVCTICEDNTAATSFCLQCDVKLCEDCTRKHKKVPGTRKHVIEDLNKLSPQRLAEINRATCNVHDDRPAEVYCSTHRELICMLCATTNHRSCAEVKAITDVATEKRRELEQQAQRLRAMETALSAQIKEVKGMFPSMRRKAKDTFDDLEQWVKKRRQEVNTLIQAEEDATMTSLAELEKWRAALALNTASVGKLVQSASGGALLGMVNSLKSRLNDLESQTGTTRKIETAALTFNFQKLDQLKSDIASLGPQSVYRTDNKAHLDTYNVAAAYTASTSHIYSDNNNNNTTCCRQTQRGGAGQSSQSWRPGQTGTGLGWSPLGPGRHSDGHPVKTSSNSGL